MQRDTSPSHRVEQAVDCGLWNVIPFLFNVCAKLLDIGGTETCCHTCQLRIGLYGDHITAKPEVASHDGSQIPHDRLVMVIRLLQALMLLMVISMMVIRLPNLLTAWYSGLYCPSNHSDISANVIENLIKHII